MNFQSNVWVFIASVIAVAFLSIAMDDSQLGVIFNSSGTCILKKVEINHTPAEIHVKALLLVKAIDDSQMAYRFSRIIGNTFERSTFYPQHLFDLQKPPITIFGALHTPRPVKCEISCKKEPPIVEPILEDNCMIDWNMFDLAQEQGK